MATMTFFVSALRTSVAAPQALRRLLLMLLVISLAGCASSSKKPAQTAPPASEPSRRQVESPEKAPVPGPAAGIHAEAEKALDHGRAAEAEILLERALRIEPRNGLYWHTLARAKFNQRRYAEAVQVVRKAETLIGRGQEDLAERNRVLMARARIAGRLP